MAWAFLRTFVQTGQMPPMVAPEHHQRIAGCCMLFFSREAVRNPLTVGLAPATVEMVRSGKMTWEEAFSKPGALFGGGSFSMSMKGAVGATRGLEAEARGEAPSRVPGGGGTEAKRRELESRELELSLRWYETELAAAWNRRERPRIGRVVRPQ